MTNNQIIAEYLGWKLTYVKNEYINYWEFQQQNTEDEEGIPNTWCDNEMFKITENSQIPFSQDWGWFMQCMSQINKDFEEHLENYTDQLWKSYDLLRTKVANCDLEKANEQAVLFINELNKIKNENNTL